MAPDDEQEDNTHPTSDESPTTSGRTRSRKRLLVACIAGLVVILVVAVVVVTRPRSTAGRPSDAGGTAGVSAQPKSPAAGSGPAIGGKGAGSRNRTRAPWGAGVLVSDNSPEEMIQHFTSRWHLTFRSAPPGRAGGFVDGNSSDTGTLRLATSLGFDDDHHLRQLECNAHDATTDVATNASLREFIYDCIAQAVTGSAWPPVKTWLDAQYGTPIPSVAYRWNQGDVILGADHHTVDASIVGPS